MEMFQLLLMLLYPYTTRLDGRIHYGGQHRSGSVLEESRPKVLQMKIHLFFDFLLFWGYMHTYSRLHRNSIFSSYFSVQIASCCFLRVLVVQSERKKYVCIKTSFKRRNCQTTSNMFQNQFKTKKSNDVLIYISHVDLYSIIVVILLLNENRIGDMIHNCIMWEIACPNLCHYHSHACNFESKFLFCSDE